MKAQNLLARSSIGEAFHNCVAGLDAMFLPKVGGGGGGIKVSNKLYFYKVHAITI